MSKIDLSLVKKLFDRGMISEETLRAAEKAKKAPFKITEKDGELAFRSTKAQADASFHTPEMMEEYDEALKEVAEKVNSPIYLEQIKAEKGYGSKALKKLEEFAKKKGADSVYLNASPLGGTKGLSQEEAAKKLQEFYKSQGYKLAKDEKTNAIMYKMLAAGVAPTSVASQINPLGMLQPLAEKYQQGKEAAMKALSNQLDFTKDKSEASNIKEVLNVAADPMNVIPGPVGIGLQAVEGMASMGPKKQFDPATIEGLYKGGMIKEETYKRAMQYACGGKVKKYQEGGEVQASDPVLQDKINAAIENTVEQAQAGDVSQLPEKNMVRADAPYGGYLANRLGVPGYEEVNQIVPDRGFLGQDLPQREALQPLQMGVKEEPMPEPRQIEGTFVGDASAPQEAMAEEPQRQVQSMQMPQMPVGEFQVPGMAAFDAAKAKLENDLRTQEARQLEQDKAMREELNKLEQSKETFLKGHQIDPKRYWGNKSTGQKLAAGFAIFLGGLGRGGQQNEVLAQLNNAINRDIEAQKEEAMKGRVGFEMQNNIYSQMAKMYDNQTQRDAATRSAMLSLANLELNKVASMAQTQTAKLQADYLRAQIQSEQVKAMREFQQASRLMGGAKNADDMAQKIMTMVPKDMQGKAFEELSKLKDIQSKMSRVGTVIDKAFNVSTVASKIPGTDAASLRATAEAELFPIVKSIVGERMTDADARILIKPYLPRITDSQEVKNQKKQELIAALQARIPGETAILSSFGVIEPQRAPRFEPRQ